LGPQRSIKIWEKPFYTLGRFGADILLHGEGASRLHAVLFHNESGETCLVDLGSKHGTYIHDFRLEPFCPHPWKEDVAVSFGPAHKRDKAWLVTSGALPIRGNPCEPATGVTPVKTTKPKEITSCPKNKSGDEVPNSCGPLCRLALKELQPEGKHQSQTVGDQVVAEASKSYPSLAVRCRQPVLYHRATAISRDDAQSHPVPKRHIEEDKELPRKRHKVSFGDLLCSRDDLMIPSLLSEQQNRVSRKASELWAHSQE